MILKSREGSVSILLIIVISSLAWSFLIFADVLIYKHSENELSRGMALSADNHMANYESSLCYDYGLLYKNQSIQEEKILAQSIRNSTSDKSGEDFISKFIEIEAVDITLGKRMINLNELKDQILQGMTLRVSVDLINKIMSLDQEIKKTYGSKAILEKKNKLDNECSELGKNIEDFQLIIHKIQVFDQGKLDGLNQEIQEINKDISSNSPLSREETFQRYRTVRSTVDELNRLHKHSIELFEGCIQKAIDTEKKRGQFSNELELEKDNINSKVYKEIKNQLNDFSDFMGFMRQHDFFNDYNYSNEKINLYQDQIRSLVGEEKLYFEGILQGVIKPVYRNIELSNDLLEGMTTTTKKKFIKKLQNGGIPMIELGFKNYQCNISLSKKIKGNEGNHGLVNVYTELKGVDDYNDGYMEEENYRIIRKEYELPSERIDYIEELDIDIYGKIILGEYLLGTLKSRVYFGDAAIDYYQKNSRRSYFYNGEVEYIIFGSRNESLNMGFVQGAIVAIRTAANLVHIYTDAEKTAIANEIGAAVAGWTGFGVPLVSNAVMLSWAVGESFIDFNELLEGKKVPLYKIAKEEWQLDLNKVKKLCSNIKSKPTKPTQTLSIRLDYRDYLRILLLAIPDDVKLKRLLDVIEINTRLLPAQKEIKVENFYSHMTIELEFLVKNKFMNPFRGFIERDRIGFEYGY